MNGLYIHIPFCRQKCNYCDFASFPGMISRADEYVTALCKEMGRYKGEPVDTVYFGGGTPSLLTSAQISTIIDSAAACFKLGADSEITIEANPCTVDATKAKELYSMGFNRVSLGAQSMIDTELSSLGRLHLSCDTRRAYNDFRAAGFSNISLDLMYAIPGQNMDTLGTSIERMLKLEPEHISCYGLKIEQGTPFYAMLSAGEITEKSDDEYADMYEMICSYLAANGYSQYELSNFSYPGYESKHNFKYWRLNDYIGIGLGAASCFKGKRYTKTGDFDLYIKSFENAEYTELSLDDMMSEYMILSFRLTSIGAVKSDFEERFGKKIEDVFSSQLLKHIKAGLILDKGDRYILSKKAYYISNSVLCDFI